MWRAETQTARCTRDERRELRLQGVPLYRPGAHGPNSASTCGVPATGSTGGRSRATPSETAQWNFGARTSSRLRSGCSSEARTTSKARPSGRATPLLAGRRRPAVRRHEARAIRNGRRRDRRRPSPWRGPHGSSPISRSAEAGCRGIVSTAPFATGPRSHVPLLRRGVASSRPSSRRRLRSGSATDAGVRNGTGTTHRVWIAGPYTAIGVTTKTTFVDRSAAQGARYNYEVVAVGSSGATSQPSNVAAVPSQASTATFGELDAALAQASDTARPKDRAAMRKLTRLVDEPARAGARAARPPHGRPSRGCTTRSSADEARGGVGANLQRSTTWRTRLPLQRLATMNVACRPAGRQRSDRAFNRQAEAEARCSAARHAGGGIAKVVRGRARAYSRGVVTEMGHGLLANASGHPSGNLIEDLANVTWDPRPGHASRRPGEVEEARGSWARRRKCRGRPSPGADARSRR